MKRFLALLLLASPLHAQQGETPLPDAPSHLTRPFALNLSLARRYSIVKDSWDTVPAIGFDYRFAHSRYRFGLSVGHSMNSGETQVTGSVNVKILEFGHKKLTSRRLIE